MESYYKLSDDKDGLFNYNAIRKLCNQHIQEIKERKPLSYILDNRKVRYVDKSGCIGYTQFGDFYINQYGVMMLISNDVFMCRMHETDLLSDTLLNTVPVVYGGVQTEFQDDEGREIYTGDVVRANRELTAMVEYFCEELYPSLRLDNHNYPLAECQKLHIVGSILHSITEKMFCCFDQYELRCHNPVYQYGVTQQQKNRDMRLIKSAPKFAKGSKPEIPPRRSRMYQSLDKLNLTADDILVMFTSETFTDDTGEPANILFADYDFEIPGVIIESIELGETINWEKTEHDIHDLLLKAHSRPQIRYVVFDLCDYAIKRKEYERLVLQFKPVFDSPLHNVVVPFEFFNVLSNKLDVIYN